MLSHTLLALAAFMSASTQSVSAKWILRPTDPLSYGRLDSIVNPGEVSTHVHVFHGASALGSTYDYDDIRARSKCTTVPVQDDLSNYWVPALSVFFRLPIPPLSPNPHFLLTDTSTMEMNIPCSGRMFRSTISIA